MMESAERIHTLENLILRYQDSYYNGEAEISDAEFDSLWDELKLLDPDNELFQKVGADSGNFPKARHRIPMGSQEKAADPQVFLSWAEKHRYAEYLVEYKLDGASLELQYDNGVLVRAVTRGDGETGDVITANAKKMRGVVPYLMKDGVPLACSGGIRGEVVMEHDVHNSLFSDKANCRNAANGLMRRKDGQGCEHLLVICYDAWFDNSEQFFTDEEEKVAWLTACGFTVVPLHICKTPQDVIDYRAEVMEIRQTLPYDIDGLVVKERAINREDAYRARPDRQIAFKFSLEEAVSILRQVEWSESGATYTPIGLFDPVELAGTTVKRASLVNPNTIRNLDIKIGSHIVVTKRGEIIPKIESVVKHPGELEFESDIVFPSRCAVCGSALLDEGTRLICPNKECPKKLHHRLEKWISVLEIRDFGDTLLKGLFDSGRLRAVRDMYTLTETDLAPYFLTEESLSKEKVSLGARKVIKSIAAHRTVSLAVFIAGFDIEGIGETLVERLVAAGFNTLEKLLEADEQSIAAVFGFGEITAHTLVDGLRENQEEMRFLASKYITITGSHTGILSGKSFCFTGELTTMKRSDAEKMVKAAGGTTKSSVTKDLSYLVTNDVSSGSSKNRKAAELGIPVVTEKEFLQMLAQENS